MSVSSASAGVGTTFSWGLDRIDQKTLPLSSTYSHRYTGTDVDVYVLSTGLRLTSGEFFHNSRARAGGAIQYTDGWGDRDCDGRGTHVASTAAGATWGVADEASIVSVKLYQCGDSLPTSSGAVTLQSNWVTGDHAAGAPAVALLDVAVDASVVDASWMTTLDNAVTAMINDGITVVVPAGDKAGVASCDQSPARTPGAITVAASTSTDDRASTSSTGSCIDLFAPGVDVRTGRHDDDLASTLASGTSMAAAHVAGAAALILDEHPSFTPVQVWTAMKADATTGALKGLLTGEPDRLLHVTPAALPAAPGGLAGIVAPTDGLTSGNVRLTWNLPDDGGAEITDYVVQRSMDGVTWANESDGNDANRAYHAGGYATGIPHWFRVAAINGVGQGPWSSSVEVTPLGVPGEVSGLTAAVAPAAGVGAGEVKLNWTAPADDGGADVSDYLIEYRPVTSSVWTPVDDGVGTSTSFTMTGLTKSTQYVFRVAAENLVGIGSRNVVGATPTGVPDAPGGLAGAVAPAAGVGSGAVKLSWTASADGGAAINDYIITRAIGSGPATVVDDGVSTETTSTVGGLTNGQPYTFQVWAKNAVGTSATGAEISATPIWTPETPGGLRAQVAPAAGVGSGQVELAWNTPSGSPVTDYLIERSADGATWTVVDDGLSTETTFTVGGLTNGTPYQFRVTAHNDVGDGSVSDPIQAIPVGTPAAPRALSAARAGSGQIGLSWTAPENGGSAITDYTIESSLDGTTWTTVDRAASAATTLTVGGLTNGSRYLLRVAAVNTVGQGPWSDPIAATPTWSPELPNGLSAAVAPAAGVGSGQVKLTWTAPSDNGSAITDYVIQRSDNGTIWRTVRDGVSTSTNATLRRLTNGSRYFFRVTATNAAGRSGWSTKVTATPRWKPATPAGLRATAGAHRVTLTWGAPTNNGARITDYVIQRAAGKQWTTVRDGLSTSRTVTVRRLTNGRQYRFRVAAVNTVGRGPWSGSVRSTPTAR